MNLMEINMFLYQACAPNRCCGGPAAGVVCPSNCRLSCLGLICGMGRELGRGGDACGLDVGITGAGAAVCCATTGLTV